jgi:hypothetical protein
MLGDGPKYRRHETPVNRTVVLVLLLPSPDLGFISQILQYTAARLNRRHASNPVAGFCEGLHPVRA